MAANVSSSMGRAKSTPRISAPSAAPVGIISIDIGGSPAGKATHPPCKPATPRAAYPIHIQRAPPESAPANNGKARRVWLMDRGVPTEEVLAEMRAADPAVH